MKREILLAIATLSNIISNLSLNVNDAWGSRSIDSEAHLDQVDFVSVFVVFDKDLASSIRELIKASYGATPDSISSHNEETGI